MSSGLSLLNLTSASVLESALGHSDLSELDATGELPQEFSQLMTKTLAQQGFQVAGDNRQGDPLATLNQAVDLGQTSALLGLEPDQSLLGSQVALEVSWSNVESVQGSDRAERLIGNTIDVMPVDLVPAQGSQPHQAFPNEQIDTDQQLLDWAARWLHATVADESGVSALDVAERGEDTILASTDQLQGSTNVKPPEVVPTDSDALSVISLDSLPPETTDLPLPTEASLVKQQSSAGAPTDPSLAAELADHSPDMAVAQSDPVPVTFVAIDSVLTDSTSEGVDYVYEPTEDADPEQAWTLTQIESDQQDGSTSAVTQDIGLAASAPEAAEDSAENTAALPEASHTVGQQVNTSAFIATSAQAERLPAETAAAKSSYGGAWLSSATEGVQVEEGISDDLLLAGDRRSQSAVPAGLAGDGRSFALVPESLQTAENLLDPSEEVANFDEVLEGFTSKNALKLMQTASAPVAGLSGVNAAVTDTKLTANPIMQFTVAQSVNTPSWGSDVTDKVMWMASQGLTEAEIQLDPPELGPLQAKVTVNQDQAQVVFTSHSAQVREALDQQATRLREMFAGEGLDLTNVDVSDQQTHEHQGRDDSDPVMNNSVDADQESEPMESSPVPAMSQYLVDQYV